MQDKIKDNQQDLSVIIPDLASMAAELVRDLDPQARPPEPEHSEHLAMLFILL